MKLGLIADVHEHLKRLDSALELLRREGVERIIFLGDLFETGALLDQAAQRLIQAGVIGVWGNHELGLCHEPNPETFVRLAGPGVDFLATLQPRMELEGCFFSHVMPHHDPTDLYQPWYTEPPPETAEEAAPLFATAPQRVIFCGHYHRWLAVSEEAGALPWDGATPLRLAPPGRWFVVIHAVCNGWCATFDTETALLTPIRLDDDGPAAAAESPDALLDALCDHPGSTEERRAALVDRLVARFPPERIRSALHGRLLDLHGPHGETILRLVEAFGDDALLAELADALDAQPELPPELLWEALMLLQGTDLLDDHPELGDRLDELADLIEADEDSLAELAAHLEEDPDGVCTALHGLASVEPQVRAEILAGLAGTMMVGPGLVEFLRLLVHCPDPTTSRAALDALIGLGAAHPDVAEALTRLVREHYDVSIAEQAETALRSGPAHPALSGAGLPALAASRPPIVASLVTAPDARGRAVIGLAAEGAGQVHAAAFLCDLLHGVTDLSGLIAEDLDDVSEFFAQCLATDDTPRLDDAPGLALDLLAGGLTLSGPATSPALRYWIERTAGRDFRPRPLAFGPPVADPDPHGLPPPTTPEAARAVLDALPGWVDDSALTYDLAEELLLREGGLPPDPQRDSGAFRYLFVNRLRDRLELDRRMLLWMAAFWTAAGAAQLSRFAAMLARELSDAQHVVPGHPYILALASRSLAVAQQNLRRGHDLRDPALRARADRFVWP